LAETSILSILLNWHCQHNIHDR